MKYLFYTLLSTATMALGASVGETYSGVIAEKGAPKSQIQVGTVRVLNYADATIKLKDNLVVSIKAVAPLQVQPSAPTRVSGQPTPAPAAASAESIKAELKDAIDRVKLIVNQPVPSVPRTRENWSRCDWFPDGWFHPGAATPDFNNVDVRKTQETKNYDKSEYVSSSLTPDRAFPGNELEFNSMTKMFYEDRSLPKKKLTEDEMLEINRLYRIIGKCSDELSRMGIQQ